MGHKGMIDAAQYIYRKLKEEHLLTRAFNSDKDQGTQSFDLVCVGHSLGAGTATILAIMLRQEFPNTRCFAYSPPGGLLSGKLSWEAWCVVLVVEKMGQPKKLRPSCRQ